MLSEFYDNGGILIFVVKIILRSTYYVNLVNSMKKRKFIFIFIRWYTLNAILSTFDDLSIIT